MDDAEREWRALKLQIVHVVLLLLWALLNSPLFLNFTLVYQHLPQLVSLPPSPTEHFLPLVTMRTDHPRPGLITPSFLHWGRGGPETDENILSTLQALVEGTHHLPTDNRLGTFQMFLPHVFNLEPMGTFMQHLECNINMYTTLDRL